MWLSLRNVEKKRRLSFPPREFQIPISSSVGTLDFLSTCLGIDSLSICLQFKRLRFNPWVRKIHCRGEWQPTRYSCLENSMVRGAWQAIVHGFSKSWTRLSDFHTYNAYYCQTVICPATLFWLREHLAAGSPASSFQTHCYSHCALHSMEWMCELWSVWFFSDSPLHTLFSRFFRSTCRAAFCSLAPPVNEWVWKREKCNFLERIGFFPEALGRGEMCWWRGERRDSTSEDGACEHCCFTKASDEHLSYGPRSPNTDTVRQPEVSIVSAKSFLVCVCAQCIV